MQIDEDGSSASSGDYFDIDRIEDYKIINGNDYFLVKWAGYSSCDNTWEPRENLTNVEEMVDEFLEKR